MGKEERWKGGKGGRKEGRGRGCIIEAVSVFFPSQPFDLKSFKFERVRVCRVGRYFDRPILVQKCVRVCGKACVSDDGRRHGLSKLPASGKLLALNKNERAPTNDKAGKLLPGTLTRTGRGERPSKDDYRQKRPTT